MSREAYVFLKVIAGYFFPPAWEDCVIMSVCLSANHQSKTNLRDFAEKFQETQENYFFAGSDGSPRLSSTCPAI